MRGFLSRASLPTALALLSLLILASPGVLLGQLGRVDKAKVALEPGRTAYEAGSDAEILVTMDIEHGWHTNSNRPTYDYLIATEVEVTPPEFWQAATVAYPKGQIKSFSFADEPLSVYEGQVVMVITQPIPAETPDGLLSVEVDLTYQACDDRSCLPPVTTTDSVEIVIGEGGEISAAAATRPVASPTDSEAETPVQGPSLAWMLLLGVLGGLILNAMPCVLPVLSLKVFGMVKSAGQGRAEVVRASLATSAGILVSFWALALLAILAKSGGNAVGWGIQFQEPTFVAALTIIVVLFCLNLWGVFEVPLPARLTSGTGGGEGIAGHFTSGLFATLMATPCSAPFLGTAIGFGLSQPAPTILAIFTAVGIGMALPYLAMAAAPRTARLLPKPGPWMGHLRITMGFLLAAAAVWLLYVLSAQISPERLAFFQLALLIMSMLIWWRTVVASRSIPRLIGGLAVVASIVLSFGLVRGGEPADRTAAEPAQQLIAWSAFDATQAEQLAAEGRLVFVDVTADWCFTCKVNERLALETPEVAAAFEQHEVVAMKADWTNRDDSIASFLAEHGRYGIPFYLLYRPGQEPHLFGELITSREIIDIVEDSSADRITAF